MSEVIVGIVKGYKANRDRSFAIIIPKVARDKLGEAAGGRRMMNRVTQVTHVTHSGYPKCIGDFPYGIRIFKTGYIGYTGYVLFSAAIFRLLDEAPTLIRQG